MTLACSRREFSEIENFVALPSLVHSGFQAYRRQDCSRAERWSQKRDIITVLNRIGSKSRGGVMYYVVELSLRDDDNGKGAGERRCQSLFDRKGKPRCVPEPALE